MMHAVLAIALFELSRHAVACASEACVLAGGLVSEPYPNVTPLDSN